MVDYVFVYVGSPGDEMMDMEDMSGMDGYGHEMDMDDMEGMDYD